MKGNHFPLLELRVWSVPSGCLFTREYLPLNTAPSYLSRSSSTTTTTIITVTFARHESSPGTIASGFQGIDGKVSLEERRGGREEEPMMILLNGE